MPRRKTTARDKAALYTSAMTPEDAALVRNASPDSDLEGEIKLLRGIIARLSPDMTANQAIILRVVAILCRAIDLQGKHKGDMSEIEQALLEAAEEALASMEREKAESGDDAPVEAS